MRGYRTGGPVPPDEVRRVVSVTAKVNAIPYRKNALEKAPSRKYLKPPSARPGWRGGWRSDVELSREDLEREEDHSRSVAEAMSIMPAMAKSVSA